MFTRIPHSITLKSILRVFAYTVGSMLIVIGLVVSLGYGYFSVFPAQHRILFGIVIILYGIYRIVSTYYRQRHEINLTL